MEWAGVWRSFLFISVRIARAEDISRQRKRVSDLDLDLVIALPRYEAESLASSFIVVVSRSGCSTNNVGALDWMGRGRRRVVLTGNLRSETIHQCDRWVEKNQMGLLNLGMVVNKKTCRSSSSASHSSC